MNISSALVCTSMSASRQTNYHKMNIIVARCLLCSVSTRNVPVVHKLGQIGPKGDKSMKMDFFRSDFYFRTIYFGGQNVLESDLKSPRLVPFGSNSDIPSLKCSHCIFKIYKIISPYLKSAFSLPKRKHENIKTFI